MPVETSGERYLRTVTGDILIPRPTAIERLQRKIRITWGDAYPQKTKEWMDEIATENNVILAHLVWNMLFDKSANVGIRVYGGNFPDGAAPAPGLQMYKVAPKFRKPPVCPVARSERPKSLQQEAPEPTSKYSSPAVGVSRFQPMMRGFDSWD